MQEDVILYLEMAEEGMNNSLIHLQQELSKLRTGKASPSMLDGIKVSYYGSPTLLNRVANVTTSDAKTLIIQPWEKSMLAPIEKSIFEANLGLTPQNDGELIRINVPPLTEERRRGLVKRAKSLGENAKISIRNARKEAMDGIKQAVKEGYPEDAGKRREKEIQDMTNKYGEKAVKLVEAREKDIMTI